LIRTLLKEVVCTFVAALPLLIGFILIALGNILAGALVACFFVPWAAFVFWLLKKLKVLAPEFSSGDVKIIVVVSDEDSKSALKDLRNAIKTCMTGLIYGKFGKKVPVYLKILTEDEFKSM